MVCSLINNDASQESFLIVVIQPQNLERMRKADPITLEPDRLGGLLPTVKYPARLRVLIAYEEDEVEVYRLGNLGFEQLFKYLLRGFKWKPEHEDGPENAFKLTRNQEQPHGE
jgi:hypothetical protein